MVSVALPGRGRLEESEWAVWFTVAVALVIGLFIEGWALGRTETAAVGNVRVSYPATWQRVREEGALLAAADIERGGVFGARVAVREVPRQELLPIEGSVVDAAANWTLARRADLIGYHLLGIRQDQVGGRQAASVDYAYLATPPQGSASGAMPGLMRATDTIVPAGDRYYILTFAAESREFDELAERQFPRFRSVYEGILTSWQLP